MMIKIIKIIIKVMMMIKLMMAQVIPGCGGGEREKERERERGCCNLPSSKLRPLYCATPGWQRAGSTGLWHAAPRNLYTTNRYCEVLTASLAPWPGWPPGYGATELLASAIFVNTEPGRKSK